MAETPRRIDIGFQGGQVLSVRVTEEVHAEFRKALSDSNAARWFELKTQDSDVFVDLSQVVYVRLDTEEHRVGFQLRALAAVDLRLLRLLRTRGHSPGIEGAAIALARSGENGLLWNALAVLGGVLSARRRDDYVRAAEIVLVTLFLNTVVKQTVRRARPVLEEELPALTPVLSGRSYPSAHASTSFAGARALTVAGLPGPALHAVAFAMALSRPYLGVHYPSDVLAGALLGDAVARLMTR